MLSRCCWIVVLAAFMNAVAGLAAPVIDPLPNVTIPAGKSLTLPITATSPGGQRITYTITSNTNKIAVVTHTNNPFWQLTVAQAAASNAPGAYYTPFRGGMVSVTNVGALTFMLFPEYAPHAVNVFQGLTTAGFYNSNTIFHRVVTNFVIQGGDPQTNGTGGAVFRFSDEFDPQAIFSGNGQLALANNGKDKSGCQFFVTLGPQRALDFRYTLFGQLVRGFSVLTNISRTAVNTTNSRPVRDEIIQLAAYVTNTTDTVLTLTATNVSGITGKITVIADAGAGGRATNTFNAVTVKDTNSNMNPLIFPANLVTNLVGPMNQTLTNVIRAVGLDREQLYWSPALDSASQAAISSFSGNFSNAIFKSLTYSITNKDGELHFFLKPVTNYVGPVRAWFDVSGSTGWTNYDEDYLTFVFGDTPIVAQSNNVTAAAGRPFSGVLLGTFTNGVPGSAASNFVASINWGDNSISAGAVGTNGAGRKTVLGAHTYAFPGSYPVYTTVSSSIGASATFLSWVRVIPTVPQLAPAAGALGPNGFSFNVESASGLTGVVQFSSNLQDWVTFTNFVGTNDVLGVRDAGATAASRRFYRAVVQ
jgi:cyclophilin family peptidyl-prolyl cis-trans isomerase